MDCRSLPGSLGNIVFNVRSSTTPSSAAPVIKIGCIRVRLRYLWHHGVLPTLMTGLDHHVTLWKVLEGFCEGAAPVERGCHPLRVCWRELKQNVRTHRVE